MDFELTDEQHDIQRMTRQFSRERIAPRATEWDRGAIFPRDIIAELGEIGVMGVCIPEQYGGAGADFLSFILVIEEISHADAGVGLTVSVQTSLATLPILSFGSEEQKRKWIPPLASGEVIGCYGLTEPGAGSDAAALVSTARRDGSNYVLNGNKQFISNAGYAGTLIFFARTNLTGRRCDGISAFIVDMSLDGVTIGKEEEKL